MKRMMYMFGGTRGAEVDLEEGDCAHCQFVRQWVDASAGSITFVCGGENDTDVRRVRVLFRLGPLMVLACAGVTAEAAASELRSMLCRQP